jgi:HEAT repeat protein
MNHRDLLRRLAIAGHEGDTATPLRALADPDPIARQLALGALDRTGALTDEQVRAAFDDPDPGVRHRATVLAATRPSVSLLPVLADVDGTVVEAAAWAAGEQEIVSDDVLQRLIGLATDDDALTREAAVAALGAIGDERGLPAILGGCADKPNIRRRAVLALAPFSGPDVDAALAGALVDRDWQVRQAAEDLLPHMAEPPEPLEDS